MTTLTEPQAQELASRDRSPSATLERQETLGQATAALAGLPANQQEVIRLKVLDGLSYREISGVTGLSVSNVGFLIHQGIKTIREQLACA